jgi:two-component system sensor histidine kinase TctE
MANVGKLLNVADIIQSTISRFEKLSNPAGIDVSFEDTAQGSSIFGDDVMLQESILNLLNNSMIQGGDALSRINISLTNNDDKLVLILADNGKGIPADKHVQAISRFSQADAGRGSGLGLPIAAKVIEAHGGRLEIKEPPIGTAIEIVLPKLVGSTHKQS